MSTDQITAAKPATPLWRNRDFDLLWSSQTLSEFGGKATHLAIPLLVLAVTGSPVDAGVAGMRTPSCRP